MNYLLERLPAGEKGVAKTRKTAWLFAREFLFAVIFAAAIVLLNKFAKWEYNSKYMYIAYGVVALVMLCLFTQNFFKFVSTAMLVSTHKFMYKEDLITIKMFDTQLSNIDGIEVEYKTPMQRLCNYGNITIYTRNTKQTFTKIAHPDEFCARLNKQAALIADSRIRRVHVTFGLNGMQQRKKSAVRKVASVGNTKATVKKVS